MRSDSGKRPPDEAHSPGKEAIRPQQRGLGGSEKRVALARCSNSGSRDYADSKEKACDARHGARVVQIALCSASTRNRSAFKILAKFRQTFSHVYNFIRESLVIQVTIFRNYSVVWRGLARMLGVLHRIRRL